MESKIRFYPSMSNLDRCNGFCEDGHLQWRQKKDPSHMEQPGYFIERSISKDCVPCLKASLEFFGFDPRDYKDFSRHTVIHLCAIWVAKECLKYLVEELGLIDLIDKPSAFDTPLMRRVTQIFSIDEFSKLLLQYGADLNKKDHEGNCPQDCLDYREKYPNKFCYFLPPRK